MLRTMRAEQRKDGHCTFHPAATEAYTRGRDENFTPQLHAHGIWADQPYGHMHCFLTTEQVIADKQLFGNFTQAYFFMLFLG